MKSLVAGVRWGMMLILFSALAILSASCGGGATETTETETEAPAESASTAQESTEQTSNTEAAAATEGQKLFMHYCAKCHGPKGLGDGPSVGSLRSATGMNLTVLQDREDEELLTTISQGKGTDMPPWGLILSLEEREELIKHLRTLGSQ